MGAGGVKVVELKMEKHRPVLFTYGFTSQAQDVHRLAPIDTKSVDQLRGEKSSSFEQGTTPPGQKIEDDSALTPAKADEYASIIKEVCKSARTVSKTAVVSLPVSAVFHSVVTLPILKKEEFDHVLKAEIKKLLPYSLDETALDYQILPHAPEAKSERVLVNAVPRKLVVFYTKIFQTAGLKLEALEPESVALSRSLIGRDTAVTMVVDMGAERTNFFIIDQAVPITHHSIELGGTRINRILEQRLGIADGEIEQIKRDIFDSLSNGQLQSILPKDAFVNMFMSVIEPVTKEIEFAFDLYLRQSGNENKQPEKIVLTGGAALFPYFADYLADKFKLKCYIADPWGRVVYQDKLKPVLGAIGPRMSVAIGLALRGVV